MVPFFHTTTARRREGGANPPLPRNCERREPGKDKQNHWDESWEGSQGLLTRKSGERPCFTHPRGDVRVRSLYFSKHLLFFLTTCAVHDLWRRERHFARNRERPAGRGHCFS